MKQHLRDDSLRIEVESMSEVALTIGRVVTLVALLLMVQMGLEQYIMVFAIISSLAIIPFVRMALSRKEVRQA